MAKLWRSLLGRNTATRSSENFTYQGIPYSVFAGGASDWAKSEDVENDFIAYCQQIYKQSGVVYAVMAARRMLFRQARLMWQDFTEGVEGELFWTPELEVFRKPWPGGTSGELLSRMDQDASLGGTAFVVREQDEERDRLRRLRPDWMTIVLTAPPAEAVKSDVAGFWFHPGRRYGVAGQPQPTDEFYLPGELCYWTPDPDPEAQYRGMSWLTPVIREVMADKAATAHKEKFFANGATLGMIISAKENLTVKQFEEWKKNVLEQHQGVDAAYKPLFLASPVDTSVQGLDLKQLDFKVTQGHGETRVCAAGRVPPIIVGVSEGLEAATYSNYGQARRAFGDGFAHSQWEDAAGALEELVTAPDRPARLWYAHQHIPFLREDQADAANIQQVKASTIRQYIDAGFEPDSAVKAVDADDRRLLKHTGLVSVQLLAPGTEAGAPESTPDEEDGSPSGAPVARHLPGLHNQKAHGRRKITGFGRIAGADLGRVSDRQLLRVFGEESASDNPDVDALAQLFEEMGTREEAARIRNNPIRRLNLQNRSEDDLYRLWNEHANAPAAVSAIQAELDRRRREEREERNRPVVSWDQHDPDTPEQRRIDGLVARGRSYREAYAETYGLSDQQLADQERLGLVDLERRAGETRRQAVRRAYGEQVHLQYLQAEAATRGHLLSAEGRRAGIDPVSLFSGPASRARRYASEDLLRWFEQNRRVTYTEFAQQVLTGRSDERFALAGNNRDFGV